MIIHLPFPDMSLATNKSKGKHWSVTSNKRSTARLEAFYLTKQANISIKNKNAPVGLKITFVQKDKRKRDLQNQLEACKPFLDGIADAIGVDDYYFAPITIHREFSDIAFTKIEIIEESYANT